MTFFFNLLVLSGVSGGLGFSVLYDIFPIFPAKSVQVLGWSRGFEAEAARRTSERFTPMKV